jgi:hypothetical protein
MSKISSIVANQTIPVNTYIASLSNNNNNGSYSVLYFKSNTLQIIYYQPATSIITWNATFPQNNAISLTFKNGNIYVYSSRNQLLFNTNWPINALATRLTVQSNGQLCVATPNSTTCYWLPGQRIETFDVESLYYDDNNSLYLLIIILIIFLLYVYLSNRCI